MDPIVSEPPKEEVPVPYKEASPESSPFMDVISPASRKLADEAEEEGCFDVRQKLIDSKLARRQAEEDRKKLANRIQMLKLEEQRALKKFEETKKKAKEIMEIRMRNAEIQRQKDEWKRKKKEEEERLAAQNKAFRERMKEGINLKLTQTLNEKKTKSTLIKNEREECEKMISEQAKEEKLAKSQRKQQIKSQEIALEQYKVKEQEEKKYRIKSVIEEKILSEHEDRLKIEADISQMEQEEYALIQKLQNTELLQQAAEQNLQQAISAPTSTFLSPATDKSPSKSVTLNGTAKSKSILK